MEQFIPVQPESIASMPGNKDEDDQYKRRFGLEPGVPADPLDEIIMGVKMGTVDIDDGDEVCLRRVSRVWWKDDRFVVVALLRNRFARL